MSDDPGRSARLDAVVAAARRDREQREAGYRQRALAMFPWVCGRCTREFQRQNLIELTVHHRDHNHDNNPADGSNWELLCRWCHDNEHQRGVAEHDASTVDAVEGATHRPFADLAASIKRRK